MRATTAVRAHCSKGIGRLMLARLTEKVICRFFYSILVQYYYIVTADNFNPLIEPRPDPSSFLVSSFCLLVVIGQWRVESSLVLGCSLPTVADILFLPFISCFCGCCLIAYKLDQFKDIVHHCPACNKKILTKAKMGSPFNYTEHQPY